MKFSMSTKRSGFELAYLGKFNAPCPCRELDSVLQFLTVTSDATNTNHYMFTKHQKTQILKISRKSFAFPKTWCRKIQKETLFNLSLTKCFFCKRNAEKPLVFSTGIEKTLTLKTRKTVFLNRKRHKAKTLGKILKF